MLEEEGYEVFEASNGREGIGKFNERPTDIVLTDIYMPEKGGIETILEIRKNSPGAKIIAMSGGGILDSVSTLSIAKDRGADHLLTKPIQIEELTLAIQKLLSRKK